MSDRYETVTFLLRVGVHFAVAVVAYFLTLVLIFPGYVAPLAAFHADLYRAAEMAAERLTINDTLTMARPVSALIGLLAGYTGYEGSRICSIAFTIFALALSLTLFERSVLRTTIPLWVSFLTLFLAVSAPTFYFNAGYDPGSQAMVFGLIGIATWELRCRDLRGILLIALFFVLSALSKESFLPVVLLYAFFLAIQQNPRRRFGSLAILGIALSSAFLAIGYSLLTHSKFVYLGNDVANAYVISLQPLSIARGMLFYVTPLMNWPCLLLAVSCIGAIVLRRGWVAAVAIFVASISLYVPYAILPNHLLGYYDWVAWPALMLLLPLALVRRTSENAAASAARLRLGKYQSLASALVVCSLANALLYFHAQNAIDGEWSLQQQNINRNVLTGIRSLRAELDQSQRVLVCGLAFPFHPWEHSAFLSPDLGFRGQWSAAIEPVAFGADDKVKMVRYKDVQWDNYDLIVVFSSDGSLAGAYHSKQLSEIAKRGKPAHKDNYELIQSLRNGAKSQS